MTRQKCSASDDAKTAKLSQKCCKNASKLPKLGARLQEAYNQIINLASAGDIVADVGTDHGFMASHLAASQKFDKVIATDISAASLKKAEILCSSLGLDVECRCGSGLFVAEEATIAAICGMGGWEIIKILEKSGKTYKFVLVAMQNTDILRRYLVKNKYKITSDKLVAEHGKFYFVMSAIKNSKIGKNYLKTAKSGCKKCKYGFKELQFGLNFDNKSVLGQQYLKSQINNLKFLENFDITNVVNGKKDIKNKQKYYNLCKKLLNEGEIDDYRDN